jgi:hypothetical protein
MPHIPSWLQIRMVHFNDDDTYKYTGDTGTHYGGTRYDLLSFDESSILEQNMTFS